MSLNYKPIQLLRLATGKCPVHGIPLLPIRGPIPIKGSKIIIREWSPMGCPRKDCDFNGAQIGFDGPVYPREIMEEYSQGDA